MKVSEKQQQVLVADSQFLITESLRYILKRKGQFIVKKVVTEKSELVKTLKKDDISLLIIDHYQIDFEGVSELKEIITSYPLLKILVITNALNKAELLELNSAGIRNIILKSAGEEVLHEALEAVIKGKKYISGELLELLFESDERKKSGEEPAQLTNSELEIVKLISDGLTTKEIAARKFISYHTVISHRKNIFRKLGVTSVSELIMYSIKAGWINTIEYHI